ncbi:hypothetical protein T484DRAFT_1837485, partial [Baffinella frigidus]
LASGNFTSPASFDGDAPAGWTVQGDTSTSSIELTRTTNILPAGETVTFRFATQNPTTFVTGMEARTASDVLISANKGVSIAAGKMVLDAPPAAASDLDPLSCTTQKDLHPLFVRKAAFCVRLVKQATSFVGEDNELNVTLSATINFPAESSITLSGFPKDLDARGLELASAENGTWAYTASAGEAATEESTGKVVVTLSEAIEAGSVTTYVFSFTNWNSTELRFSEIGGSIQTLPAARKAKVLSVSGGGIAKEVLEAPQFSASACDIDQSPFRVVLPGICRCSVTHNSTLPGGANLVTLGVTYNVDLPTAIITATTNLTIVQSPATNYLAVKGVGGGSFEFHEYFATGAKVGQTLVSLLPGAVGNAGTKMEMTLDVRNPVVSDSRDLTLDLFPCSGLITTDAPAFLTASVGQSNPYPSQANIITVTLETNYVPAQMALHISGLPKSVFSSTADEVDVVVTSPPACGAVYGAPAIPVKHPKTGEALQGMMRADSGASEAEVWLEVDTAVMMPNTKYAFSFSITNPAGGPYASPRTMRVTARAADTAEAAQVIPQTMLMTNEAADVSSTCLRDGLYMPVIAESRPLHIREPLLVLTSSVIGQASPFPGVEDNQLNVTLAFNVDLLPGTVLTLTGLKGLTVATATALSLEANERLEAAISKTPGLAVELTVSALVNTTLDAPAILSFTLINVLNPKLAQTAPVVLVAASVTMDLAAVAIPPPKTLAQLEALFDPTAVATATLGQAAPLFILAAAFRTKLISQTVPYPAALNTIDVELAFTVPISAISQTIITISGLTGQDQNLRFDTTKISGDFRFVIGCGKDTDASEDKRAFFRNPKFASSSKQFKGEDSGCQNGDPALCKELQASFLVIKSIVPQDVIKISFQIFNPTTTQDSPGARISASGIEIPATAMDAPPATSGGGDGGGTCGGGGSSCSDPRDSTVLFIRAAGFDMVRTTIGQTNPSSGAANVLRITLVANGPIAAETTITLAGLIISPNFNPDWAGMTAGSSLHVISQGSGGVGCSAGTFDTPLWGNATGTFSVRCGAVSAPLTMTDTGAGYNATGSLLNFSTCETQPTGYTGSSAIQVFETPDISSNNVAKRVLILSNAM